ncbi:hypothetical protein E2C01_060311 [Portunus trituberculatus]|uniref:Uncharacterized protein n=1 Tax=Portunus trituberculatus TaxID=210409 RepID=A0A5B7H940_PORTR|nr:hypothetical protein [Portunus trituberculatus]
MIYEKDLIIRGRLASPGGHLSLLTTLRRPRPSVLSLHGKRLWEPRSTDIQSRASIPILAALLHPRQPAGVTLISSLTFHLCAPSPSPSPPLPPPAPPCLIYLSSPAPSNGEWHLDRSSP